MKFKLINKQTGEERLCEKVVIDGWDYYVSDEKTLFSDGKTFVTKENIIHMAYGYNYGDKVVIASNNPIDIPKVVDEVEMLANIEYPFAFGGIGNIENTLKNHFIKGYNKSQETHPNSDENMKLFGKFCTEYDYRLFGTKSYEELLQLWKEQKPKTLYYE